MLGNLVAPLIWDQEYAGSSPVIPICGRVERRYHSGLITREIAGSTPVPATAAALLEADLLHTQIVASSILTAAII